jgi:hypothetical protein
VAVIAAWLAWEASLVRARQKILSEFGLKYSFVTAEQWQSGESLRIAQGRDNPSPSKISRLRLWMGDKPIQHYTLPMDVSKETVARLGRLFPEAAVGICCDGPTSATR